jgi:hypothetical protein
MIKDYEIVDGWIFLPNGGDDGLGKAINLSSVSYLEIRRVGYEDSNRNFSIYAQVVNDYGLIVGNLSLSEAKKSLRVLMQELLKPSGAQVPAKTRMEDVIT